MSSKKIIIKKNVQHTLKPGNSLNSLFLSKNNTIIFSKKAFEKIKEEIKHDKYAFNQLDKKIKELKRYHIDSNEKTIWLFAHKYQIEFLYDDKTKTITILKIDNYEEEKEIKKNILDLTAKEAKKFFLESENYCNINLPEYFDFSNILSFVENEIGNRNEDSIKKVLKKGTNETNEIKDEPKFYDDVNYKIQANKDGKYKFRTFELINPYLYYLLIREITKENNWKEIKKRFNEFKNENLIVSSIPSIKNKNSVKANNIKTWWEKNEQESIKLSLEYKYIFISDITNCYPSIYTHSIVWAFIGKDNAKVLLKHSSQEITEYEKEIKNKHKNNIGTTIDCYIQKMEYQQTNGIPIGSIISDFIAELILGYVDMNVFKQLKEKGINDYKILRYRDDYRIFSNNKEEINEIAITLQEKLAEVNFQINSSKTLLSEDIINASIKEDKLKYIERGLIYRGNKTIFNTCQQELLFILRFSQHYPDSGTLKRLLNKFLERLQSIKQLTIMVLPIFRQVLILD